MGFFNTHFIVVDRDDDAINQLALHFKSVIQRIMDGDWRHSSIGLAVQNENSSSHSWTKEDLEKHQVFHKYPHAFFQVGLDLFTKTNRSYPFIAQDIGDNQLY